VSVVAGNRVLVKDQTAPEDNGIYLCASGAWTRTTDAATFDSLVSAFTFIEQGSHER
jgi:phage-related tail fiber protein